MILKVFKKNQIVVGMSAIALMVVGYLSYMNNNNNITNAIETSTMLADSTERIGEATLVSSTSISENEVINTANNTVEKADYFIESKLEREKMYSQMLETYQKMYENDSVSPEQKAIAANEITKINETKNAIMISENLIKTKGFKDVVILINKNSINVVINKEELSQEEISQIQNIVIRELETTIENIHISNK